MVRDTRAIVLSLLVPALIILTPQMARAMNFQSDSSGRMEISGSVKASFGMTQYLDWVDNHSKGDDADLDATREMAINAAWLVNDSLKAVISFQLGEGTTGGYFGASDALVGGEEDGNEVVELDRLYIDYTTESKVNFKIGSQSACLNDLSYGSNIMNEVPPGISVTAPLSKEASLEVAWFRIADLMDDSLGNTDDQADLLWVKAPYRLGSLTLAPWAAYASIQEDVVDNAPSFMRYAYFNYPALLSGANGAIIDPTPTDDVSSYYVGLTMTSAPSDDLYLQGSFTYGSMDWETAAVDATVAGFFVDFVARYNMGFAKPEVFAIYTSGPDANDDDLDMMPVLIGGPTYTSSFFGGSRFNDNMFDSYDTTYAASMWALGFKLKDIRTGPVSHEFQIMVAGGTADDSIFQKPNDTLLNEDEGVLELNFNSQYKITDNLVFATELGYMNFSEDKDYNEAVDGEVKDFWKAACALELSF